MTDFWLGITIGFLGGFWLFGTLAILLSLGMERVPTVDGAHTPDEDDLGDAPSMAWLDDADAEWLTQDALLRWNGSHE
jgi:hypothetical protein